MKRREFLIRSGASALGLAALGAPTGAWAAPRRAGADPRPNLIVFLVDDMGWTDSALYGSSFYESPSLARLAAGGMRFTAAHAAAPLCSATRASLMSGQYPHRVRLTGAIVLGPGGTEIDNPTVPTTGPAYARVTVPQFRTHLPLEQYTIAEALHDAGYTTCHIGKWHLGNATWWPEHQGFDYNIGGGYWPSPPSYFSPYRISTLPDGPAGEYITDRLTTEAENFIEAHKNGPFFLNFWQYAVHGPWQAKPDLIAKYQAKADPQSQHRNPTYAAMLESMDQSLGRVLDKLDSLGIANNTLIIFMSDNGGLIATNGANIQYISSNAPLRGGKATIYEGGTREPMVVRWPGVVAAGSICDTPVSTVDFYPTLLAAAGVAPNPAQTLDGASLAPLLTGTGRPARDAIFCHFPHYILDATPPGRAGTEQFWNTPSSYVVEGDWKLIRFYGEGPTKYDDRYELYNLAEDLGETNDLSLAQPGKVAELAALLDQNLADTAALMPAPNPNYTGSRNYDGWSAQHNCVLSADGGILRIEGTDTDPYIFGPTISQTGTLSVMLRLRTTTTSPGGQLFWATAQSPGFAAARRIDFPMTNDGQWHEYVFVIPLPTGDTLTQLRFDPGGAAGVVEADWIRVIRPASPDPIILEDWSFDNIPVLVSGWAAVRDCTLAKQAGTLRVDLTGPAPSLVSPAVMRFGPLLARLRLRMQTGGGGEPGYLSWAEESTGYVFAPERRAALGLVSDSEWHEYEVALPVAPDAKLIQLRLDLAAGPGNVQIDWVRLYQPADLGP
ncbi:MAG: sulfatase, partial [bacterium]|nr:sulfatase [bacterium]